MLVALLAVPRLSAKIQFDVFAGYGDANSGGIRSGGWFPIGFEVMNDEPSFDAVIEVSSGQLGGQVLKILVELPTNTLKRIVVPAFPPRRPSSSWMRACSTAPARSATNARGFA